MVSNVLNSLPLLADRVGPADLLLPGLGELGHQLLVLLQLVDGLLSNGGAGSRATRTFGVDRKLASKLRGRP